MMTLNDQIKLPWLDSLTTDTLALARLTDEVVTAIHRLPRALPSCPTMPTLTHARPVFIGRVVCASHAYHMGQFKTRSRAILLHAGGATQKGLQTPWTQAQLWLFIRAKNQPFEPGFPHAG